MGGDDRRAERAGRGLDLHRATCRWRGWPSAPGARAAATRRGQAAPERRRRPLRVLAAEDNAVNQLVLKTLLQQVGVEPA